MIRPRATATALTVAGLATAGSYLWLHNRFVGWPIPDHRMRDRPRVGEPGRPAVTVRGDGPGIRIRHRAVGGAVIVPLGLGCWGTILDGDGTIPR